MQAFKDIDAATADCTEVHGDVVTKAEADIKQAKAVKATSRKWSGAELAGTLGRSGAVFEFFVRSSQFFFCTAHLSSLTHKRKSGKMPNHVKVLLSQTK